MRDRLIELFREAKEHPEKTCPRWELPTCGGCDYDKGDECDRIARLADYLLANGVIVLPCKVGDTVYVHYNIVWHDECCNCEHFQIGGFGDPHECARTKSPFKHPDCIEISERIATEKDIYHWLAYGDFGKTVFLTREEAEQALKEGAENA